VDHSRGWVSDAKLPNTLTVDWVHPNAAGDERLARNWLQAMQPYLQRGPGG
jgi:lysophospholipase L1-like esterase